MYLHQFVDAKLKDKNFDLFLRGIIDINQQNARGETLLVVAARINFLDLLNQLFNAGADPNISDENGNTALRVAISKNKWIMIKSLFDRGANPYIKNSMGDSVQVMVAAKPIAKRILARYNIYL